MCLLLQYLLQSCSRGGGGDSEGHVLRVEMATLGGLRTGARHADGRLSGLGSEHVLRRKNAACGRVGFIQN
jgi:hypothetical protein